MKRALHFGIIATMLSLQLLTPAHAASSLARITTAGPGGKIEGIDISLYQHPGGAPIDFRQMYNAGIRFVIIKGGDTFDQFDAQAVKYLATDRAAAQRASMYTSFYYYATLPDSYDPAVVVSDAKAQAQKTIWRLASLGGYNRRDLPVALDLENNCVRLNNSGTCAHVAAPQLVTLWAQTWLDTVAKTTGKKPFLYSYPQFLENSMVRSSALRQYPLWIARYGTNPTLTSTQLNAKSVGCYAHSWSNADCSTQWQIWQYTSCGIPGKYGVPGDRVDLNVFNGNTHDFMSLVRGTWQPTPAQMLPFNEPTTLSITSQNSATNKDPVIINVNVTRPDGTPVVAGSVSFTSATSLMSSGVQNAVRSASGSWTLRITGLPAGNYLGTVNFQDSTSTEAASQEPIEFTVSQAPTPTPTPTPSSSSTPSLNPTPSPSPTAKKPPVNSCAGQFRN
jgi:GH25 family lysozyme M1 (1,4-beta-N-acetylmuramidase)